MYVIFDINVPGMELVKNELRLHGVVENHTHIENPSLLEKKLQNSCINLIFSSC